MRNIVRNAVCLMILLTLSLTQASCKFTQEEETIQTFRSPSFGGYTFKYSSLFKAKTRRVNNGTSPELSKTALICKNWSDRDQKIWFDVSEYRPGSKGQVIKNYKNTGKLKAYKIDDYDLYVVHPEQLKEKVSGTNTKTHETTHFWTVIQGHILCGAMLRNKNNPNLTINTIIEIIKTVKFQKTYKVGMT